MGFSASVIKGDAVFLFPGKEIVVLKRIYKDSKTIPFSVRVRESESGRIARLATRHGIDAVQARRRIVELGILEFEKEVEAVA